MGVTLFYKGKLKQARDIQPFISEVEDICQSAGWEYTLYTGDDGEDGIPYEGITFNIHEKVEPVFFFFHKDGRLANLFLDVPNWDADNELSVNFTKTQFGGADRHIALCRLFEYLFNRWFAVFEIHDDGGYYETKDRTELERRIDLINEGIDVLAAAFSQPENKGLEIGDIETKVIAILQALKDRHKKKED